MFGMEIEVDKIFNSLNSVQPLQRLQTVIDQVDQAMIEQTVNSKYRGTIFNDVYRINAEIKARLKAIDSLIAISSYNELLQATSLSNFYFQKAFIDKEKLAVYKFIIANNYFKHPIKNFLDRNSIPAENISFIVTYLSEALDSVSCNINVPDHAPYSEKKWYNDFIEGVKDSNIVKTYEFVNCIERGHGFLSAPLFEDLVLLLFDLDRSKFRSCIVKKEKVADFIIFLQDLGRPRIVKFAASYSFKNKWLIFELIRQITSEEKAKKVDNVGEVVIKKSLLELFEVDRVFCVATIRYFENSLAFNGALGLWLPGLKIEDRNEIIKKCFIFNNTGYNGGLKENLLQKFDQIAVEEDTRWFLNEIYTRINHYEESLLEIGSDFFAYKVIFNDFSNFIIIYYRWCLSLQQIAKEINNELDKIQYLESNWFKDSSKYTTGFFLHFSKLHLLSLAYRDIAKEQKVNFTFPSLNLVLKDSITIQRFFRKNEKTELNDTYSFLTSNYSSEV